ncbi:MAG TPA: hypothetical protein VE078_03720, partial [Thermoanaerobaculia bacterium]|nr:hypothetical protein [Thermoanaerobaculia bacterium]
GRIALGLGRSAEAERALSLALEAFLELGIGLDAALVAFDLARVYARRGDCAAVKRIAADIVPVFQSCHVQPEALAALALFRDAANAADIERITDGLLDHLSELFRQLQRRPDSRSEG